MIQALVDDIADGLIAAAYVHHIYDVPIMFSHAGISANFYAYLERQLRKKNKSIFSFDKTSNTKKSKNTLSAEEIAGYVNGVLSKQVAACTRFPCHEFGHEVFEAGPDRGGSGIGGPFWVDFSSLEAAAKNQLEPRHILQVVGHTMAWCYDPRREGVHPPLQQTECALGLVRPTHDLQSVCVDGGMYLGARAYLTIGVDAHFRAHQAHVPFVGGMAGTGVDTGAGVGAYQVRDLTAAACRMSALAS
ncbi:hypothetical protein B484DRAFT_459368 [Ochromonadaceae sp. CCMP2298]|nr:hypothetical protein B484DRAFT_459368 [Ochromonadaceae sp. CCMP2298]